MDKEIETTINRLLADKKMAVDLADYLIKENVKLREALRDLLEAVDGLFPTDGPVKAKARAALKEGE
jgi:hypothetical protein